VKRFLRSNGVLVLERLGHRVTSQLAWQSSARLITAPFSAVCTDQLGRLSHVSHQLINNKSYVCLDGGARPLHTLVLCALTSEAGQELQQASTAGYRALVEALRERVVLLGGGAWQKHLSDYVRELGRRRAAQLSEQLGCCRSDVLNVAECVADSLHRVSQLVDPQQLHQHSESSASHRAHVLDVRTCCVNGWNTAVLMAESLLTLEFHSPVPATP